MGSLKFYDTGSLAQLMGVASWAYARKESCLAYAETESDSYLFYLKYIPTRSFTRKSMQIITIIGCCVSGIIKSAMITECWTLQSSHRDTFFSIYLVNVIFHPQYVMYNCGVLMFILKL